MAPYIHDSQTSPTVEQASHDQPPEIRPLKAIVIGAGIAGLSAAVGLRRAGHDVEVFEQSSFANEIGAAIHLCPNASRILLRWGLDPVKARFDITRSGLTANASTLQPLYEADYSHIPDKYSAPWYLSHRVDLHNGLKGLATRDDGKGSPAKINLRSKVTAVDENTGAVTLADSTTRHADVIIAGDGVHSSLISQVTGYATPAKPTGFSAYRFLIPTEELLEDERTRHIIDGKEGKMKIFVGEGGRRLVWYPCRAGTIQNFVAIHPDSEDSRSVEDWNVNARVEDAVDEFKTFHPDLVAAIGKAHDVKLWKLLYRQPIPTWHRGRLLLIGDAAHPMLPHQGQAGAQSIEDGAAIGILLSGLTASKDSSFHVELEQRLAAFEDVRRKRASVMQIFSNAGQDEAEKIRGEASRLLGEGTSVPSSQADFHEFNFGHDVVVESEKALRHLTESKQAV